MTLFPRSWKEAGRSLKGRVKRKYYGVRARLAASGRRINTRELQKIGASKHPDAKGWAYGLRLEMRKQLVKEREYLKKARA